MDAVLLQTRISCIVGILPRERVEPQPIDVRLRMQLDLGPTGDTGDLAQSVDYASVLDQVRFLAIEGRFRLIESLGLAILRAVLAPPADDEARAAVARARVRIDKPAVLLEACPGVRLARDAAWAAGGDVLVDVPEVTVRRRTLQPGDALSDGVALGVGAVAGPIAVPARFEQRTTVLHLVRDRTRHGGVPDRAGPR
ncbi:MAG: dihydroneopterin aldolase [Myxococcota bacterium]